MGTLQLWSDDIDVMRAEARAAVDAGRASMMLDAKPSAWKFTRRTDRRGTGIDGAGHVLRARGATGRDRRSRLPGDPPRRCTTRGCICTSMAAG